MEAEFVVVGGGLAGVCMALSAARHGVDTVLINDRPTLGGNSSSEVRVVPAGAAQFQAWCRETGLIEEILLRDRARNHRQFYENGLTNSMYDLVLLDLVSSQPNLRTLLNTSVRDAQVTHTGEHTILTAVRANQLASGVEYDIRGAQFADCTGDGTVAHLAGADWAYGRESRATYLEALAPATADGVTSGSTLCLHARDVGRPIAFEAPTWAVPYTSEAEIGAHRGFRFLDEEEFGGFWWIEIGAPYHQINDAADIQHELLRHVLGIWGYLKNHHPERRKLVHHALEWFGLVPGKRESRRILGDIVLTERDCQLDQAWDDRVGIGGWYLDLHVPGGILNKHAPGEASSIDANYRNWSRVPPFSVPLRALYSRSIDNLWLGGRCISASHVALGALRVQQTLAALGQAVGVAASAAINASATPRQFAADAARVADLQQQLLRDDVRILDARNCDPDDLALSARVQASSEAALAFGDPVLESFDLRTARGLVFPVVTARIESMRVHLVNDSRTTCPVAVTLAQLERIWDNDDGTPIFTTQLDVPGNFAGWVKVPVALDVDPGHPYRLALESTGPLRWSWSDRQPPGTLATSRHTSTGGVEATHRDLALFASAELELPAYVRWTQEKWTALALELCPVQFPFAPDNVVNGIAWPEALPNLWMSDPVGGLPQHIDLNLGRRATFDTIELRFDTNLNVVLGSAPGLWRAPECVSEFRVLARIDDSWIELHHERDNYLRHRVLRFPAVSASAVRIEIRSTNASGGVAPTGDDLRRWRGRGPKEGARAGAEARLYDVRLYRSQERSAPSRTSHETR